MNQIDIPVFKAQLLDELRSELDTQTEASTSVIELDKRRPRRHRSAILKVAAAAVVLAGAGAITTGGSNDSPTFALTESANGIITVTWDDGFTDGAALAQSLRDAGVDINVNFLSASPSMIGNLQSIAPTDSDVLATGFTYDNNAMVIDTSQVTGEYRIDIGIASDDPWELTGSAFDHDEVLDGLPCAVPAPMQASDIAPLIADRGLDVVWILNRVVDAPPEIGERGDDQVGPFNPFTLAGGIVDSAPAGLVLYAMSFEPGSVEITVLAEGESPDKVPELTESPSVACTPERAARWNQ